MALCGPPSCHRSNVCVCSQTSTPASSFLMKSTTPESLSSAESFQSTHILLYASSDYIDITEEEPKLPYR